MNAGTANWSTVVPSASARRAAHSGRITRKSCVGRVVPLGPVSWPSAARYPRGGVVSGDQESRTLDRGIMRVVDHVDADPYQRLLSHPASLQRTHPAPVSAISRH